MTMDKIELIKKLRTLQSKRVSLNRQIEETTEKLQALCDPLWKLEQVVGDGRRCLICDKHEYCGD